MIENSDVALSEKDQEKLRQFKEDITADSEVSEEARVAANEDMRFVNVPGGMWEDFLQEDFDQDRVKLELDLVSDFLNSYIGEWNQNRVGVEFKPDDSATSKDDADLINGIYRFDFRKGSGKLATDNAVDEVATCGVGAMKIATVFEDEEDPENDNQTIEWRPVYNAYSSIYWDQSAKRIDKRDANHCTQLDQFTVEAFKKQWPEHKPVSAFTPNDLRFNNLNGGTAGKDIVYVGTRYEIKKIRVDMFVYNNLVSGKVEAYDKDQHEQIKAELAADDMRVFVRKRKIVKQIVEKTVFSGDAILEDTRRIAGKWIPIIPFYGFRAYVDGVETYRGFVRKLKDAGRLFNMQVSQLAENAASAGQEVPIFAKQQMLDPAVQAVWADKNNKPYLICDPLYDDAGNIISAGPIGYNKPQALDQSTATLINIVPDFVQNVTGSTPNEAFDSEMSGKAIKALVKRENLKTQVVTDNITNAIVWSGTVYQSIAADIYSTNRIVQTVSKDGTESEVQLMASVIDEQTGALIEGVNDITGKKFQSYPDAGPQYETLAEQTVEELKGMMEALSQTPAGEKYMDVMVASMIANISGVGLDPLKEFNRNIMVAAGMVKPETPEEKKIAEQARQPKEDPQAKLAEAAANQQNAEAASLQASAAQKMADAQKKTAETLKIESEIGLGDRKIAADQQEQLLDNAIKLREGRAQPN